MGPSSGRSGDHLSGVYVGRLGAKLGIALDPDGPTGVEVEGAGTLDIFPTGDGTRVLLRAVLAQARGTHARALRLNARPAALGGAALGQDGTDGLALVRLVDVRDLAFEGFERAFADFVAALRELPALLEGEDASGSTADGVPGMARPGATSLDQLSPGWIRS